MCNFSLVYQRYAGYKVVGLHCSLFNGEEDDIID